MKTTKAIRELLSMTQGELGKSLGISQGSISAYESGIAAIPVRSALRLIEVAADQGVHLSLDQIYGRDSLSKSKSRRAKPTATA